jgi:hypothetical protein
MEKLDIIKENAIKAYNEGCPDVKKILTNLFGKDVFVPANIMDIVTSFLDACKVTGDNPNDKKFTEGPIHRIAQEKLEVICEALRQGVILSFANENQKKWFPWMKWDKQTSGFRFHVALYDYSHACADLGSRLCVDTEAKAKYLGTHPEFVKLLNQLLINHEK